MTPTRPLPLVSVGRAPRAPRGPRAPLRDALLVTGGTLLIVSAALLAAAHADGERSRKQIVRATMPAVAMVLSVEKQGNKLKPIGSGSGTIIAGDGSVLTNYHVIGDSKTRDLHDLFIIARFRSADSEPELVCAGKPAFGKLKPELDLALIKCDLDMNMKPYKPKDWPTIPVGRSEEMIPGEQILVLGYPDVGGSTIQVTQGLLSGWMREDKGSSHRAYMKTDAAISHGNSGGTAVDEDGKLIGVPTAFRVTTAEQGQVVVTAGKVGLIRPIEHARDLIAVAAAGWTPSADNEVPESDGAIKTQSAGVRITSKVVDASNRRPVEGAFVVIFRPEIGASEVDIEKLEAQALSYGQTNAGGVFSIEKLIPRGQTYTVAVIARGYKPLVANGALVVSSEAPSQIDPWEIIRIERR